MIFGPKSQSSLGVDIGTKVIRAVELSGTKKRIVLENYGEVNLDIATKDFFRSFDKKTLAPAVDNISVALRAIISESGIETKNVVFSLPDFSTFYTTFTLPPMPKKDLAGAISFEARKYIPLPLSEVVLDWQLMNSGDPAKNNNELLVMAIPSVIIDQYKRIAEESGLELIALEAEAMALKRSVTRTGDLTSCLIEIGFQSTNISIVDVGFLKTSFSFDMAGKDLTFRVSESLNLPVIEAEQMKKKEGLAGEDVNRVLSPILSLISEKAKMVIRDFESKHNKKVERVVICGGTALLPKITEYFDKSLNNGSGHMTVETCKPFANIIYPEILKKKIEEIGPTYAIALGEALRKFE